jgi:pyruvate,water dikinase
MPRINTNFGTGLDGLDNLLTGLIPGDNIVWHVNSVDEYLLFVGPACEAAIVSGRKVVYFRFANHPPLLAAGPGVEVCELKPTGGFETFISDIHSTIDRDSNALYVFDLLSDLTIYWHSDQMLGNFFLLTCPYILDVGAIAYFALLRQNHSTEVTTTILETAQIVINVFSYDQQIFIHPLKVQERHSRTMFMLHVWNDNEFLPVTLSATISKIMTGVPWSAFEGEGHLGLWNRTFAEAHELLDELDPEEQLSDYHQEFFTRLLRMAISRDERILRLAEKYLNFQDIISMKKRIIGTGLIGGKSLGMLLAGAIIRKNKASLAGMLEPHDSFFVGSDVFYTFVVRNGLWWIREQQKDQETFLEDAEQARQRMLAGIFPENIVQKFSAMLDYFGQSPIIVRSSSLLEDNYGNSFAGKYDSIFCANQGTRQQRLDDFLLAVRTIYASTMSDDALAYRASRGLLEGDEQMALLVQRVSGGIYGDYFYPQVAGVGLSYNPYVWNKEIDPEAGAVRLVFGLGTRAVDRSDDDYTRVIALNAPERRVESNFDSVRRYTQRRVDILDLSANQFASQDFSEVVRKSDGSSLAMFASIDKDMERFAERTGREILPSWFLTFDKLINETDFVQTMRTVLETIEEAYEYPVEMEFTTNFPNDGGYQMNIVQCRPFQVKGGGQISEPPSILSEDLVLETHGAVIGQSRLEVIDHIIYVVPSLYGELPLQERYQVARIIGQITRYGETKNWGKVMLLGPGRWGTSTPFLGVPVNFSEIRSISILCEIVAMREGVVPDVSLGTHFFHELVEQDILYLAHFPDREDNYMDNLFFERLPNRLPELFPDQKDLADVIRVLDLQDLKEDSTRLTINANSPAQCVICYLERDSETVV